MKTRLFKNKVRELMKKRGDVDYVFNDALRLLRERGCTGISIYYRSGLRKEDMVKDFLRYLLYMNKADTRVM